MSAAEFPASKSSRVFALYDKPDEIAALIDDFLARTLGRPARAAQE